MILYIVQEADTSEVIGAYDTFEAAKIAGEIWTSRFYIVEKTLNSPPETGRSGGRLLKVIYDTIM